MIGNERATASSRRWLAAALAIPLAGLAGATPASALLPQSWNGYHWARTGPLAIGYGDNVSSAWDGYLRTAATDWSRARDIDLIVTTGKTTASACTPAFGGVQVCSGNYGATGWLGYTSLWTSGGFVVQGTVKINDYYFAQTKYNTASWRQATACHELGHALGLNHSDVNFSNKNNGSCLDYTSDPSGKIAKYGPLKDTQASATDLSNLNRIYGTLDTTQLSYTKPTYFSGAGLSIDGTDIEVGFSLVPEPSAWALLIGGFGLVGAAMRRRKAVEALPA